MLIRHWSRIKARLTWSSPRPKGQGLVEFALITPLLLLFILGIMEAGRMLVIYSSVSSAARQAARYGSVAGDSPALGPDGVTPLAFYEDCTGIRDTALRTGILVGLDYDDIGIAFDRGTILEPIGRCPLGQPSPTLSETIKDGYRILVTATAIYRPLVPFVPLPDMPMTFSAARTIFTSIVGPTSEPPPNPDVSITKQGAPLVVSPNGHLTYWITATNSLTSGVLAHDIFITDTLPLSVTLTQANLNTIASVYNWNCTFVVQSPPPQQIRCTRVSPLTPGQSAGFSYVVQVPLYGGVTLTNTAFVGMSDIDTRPQNNQAVAVNQVLPGADLEAYKTANPTVVGAGTPVTYTLWVVNHGGDISRVRRTPLAQASYIWITDTVPSGAQFLALGPLPAGWTCPPPYLTTIACYYAEDLAIGAATPSLTIVMTAPLFAGTLNNVAQVAPSNLTADPLPLNNVVTATTEVVTQADIELFLAGPSGAMNLGNPFTYRLTATNRGPSIASGIVLIDTLPAGLAFVNANGWAGCVESAGVVTCNYGGTLNPGETSTDLILTVQGTAEGTFLNVADVSASQPDLDLANNHRDWTTTISDCRPGWVATETSVVTGGSPDQVQADGVAVSQVLVTLRDRCGAPVAGTTVALSVAGVASNITVSSGYSNVSNANGQIQFDIRASTAGLATYTPVVTNANQANFALTSSAGVTFYDCVRVTGQKQQVTTQTYVDFRLTNATGRNWRLTDISLAFPTQGGRKLEQVSISTAPVSVLWSGSWNNNPFTIPGSGNWNGGTDGARTLNDGVTGLSLLFGFSKSTPGEVYTLVTTWDDGSGHTCTAADEVSP